MSLGADQFIDYASEDFTTVLAHDPADLTLDFIRNSAGVRIAGPAVHIDKPQR